MPKTVPAKKPSAPAKTKAVKEVKAKKPTKAEVIQTRETARDKKARQRAAKRASGLVQVAVWVSPDQADAVRDFASSLPVARRETVPQGPTLFDPVS